MKARTAKERTVEALTAQYIHPLTDEQIRAIYEAVRPDGYVLCPGNTKNNGLVWCTNCGQVVNYRPGLLINNGAPCACEHCGTRLQRVGDYWRGRGHNSHEDCALVAMAETHEDWQIFRVFLVSYSCRLGQPHVKHAPVEVVRRWYNVVRGGLPVVWSVGYMGYNGGFALSNDLALKREDTRPSYYGTTNYRVCADEWAQGGTWHRLLKRDGCNGESTARLLDLSPHQICDCFAFPQFVTLVKSHNYALARYYATALPELTRDWPSLKIALRNGYKIEDVSLWRDLLRYLSELGKDTRSPRWICPEKLIIAHNNAMHLVHRKQEQERKERAAAEVKKAEPRYFKKVRDFLDMKMAGHGFVIAVIPTVEDVRIEGEKMHHCVFDNRYYAKAGVLLLSAKDDTGARLETIEYSLSTGKVLQSRAACNLASPKHDEILAVMAAHSADLQRIWRRSQKNTTTTNTRNNA